MRVKRVHIIVLTLAVSLVAAAFVFPILVHRHKEMQREDCLQNLVKLTEADEAVAQTLRLSFGDPISAKDTASLMLGHVIPICPAGGEYIIRNVGDSPLCTVHGDLLMERHGKEYVTKGYLLPPGTSGTSRLGKRQMK